MKELLVRSGGDSYAPTSQHVPHSQDVCAIRGVEDLRTSTSGLNVETGFCRQEQPKRTEKKKTKARRAQGGVIEWRFMQRAIIVLFIVWGGSWGVEQIGLLRTPLENHARIVGGEVRNAAKWYVCASLFGHIVQAGPVFPQALGA